MSAVLRLLRIAVVVAAGVGAWFGYDAYVAAEDAPTVSDPVDESPVSSTPAPWADLDLVVADSVWDGPTRTSVLLGEGTLRETTDFDPSSGRAQTVTYDAAGVAEATVEVDANEVHVRRIGEDWTVPGGGTGITPDELRTTAFSYPVPTLADLVAPEVWPYTKIMNDVAGGTAQAPIRVLTIRMKGGAFAAAEPAMAAQWRSNSYVPHRQGRVEIDVGLDSTGRVVRLQYLGLDDVVYEFDPLAAAPVFEAPFVD